MWIGGLLSTLSLPIKCLFLEESLCLLRERYTLNFRKHITRDENVAGVSFYEKVKIPPISILSDLHGEKGC